jgi:hypothetical protein
MPQWIVKLAITAFVVWLLLASWRSSSSDRSPLSGSVKPSDAAGARTAPLTQALRIRVQPLKANYEAAYHRRRIVRTGSRTREGRPF